MLNWSREKVKNYSSLQQICPEAWQIIGTTFEQAVPAQNEDVVPQNGTTVPHFTERLLRSILDLTSEQQLELVSSLAKNEINKGKFKALAENYRARNEMYEQSVQMLGNLGEDFLSKLHEEVQQRR